MTSLGKDVHIDAPQLVTERRRITDAVATAVVWVIYSYLWAPLISLIAWLLGFEFAYDVMVRAGGAEGLVTVLKFYGIVLVCIIVVVTAWSAVNRYRFADKERRRSVQNTTDEDIAAYFALPPGELEKLRGSLRANVYVAESGQIERVSVLEKESDRI